MFNAGDSGFSELTSLASSEDENLTNDLPSTRYLLVKVIKKEYWLSKIYFILRSAMLCQ